MSFPYVFESNFERGTNADWDSEEDTATPAQIDFPHYTELARHGMTPHSGAYCMRAVLAGQTDDGTVTEADIAISLDGLATIQFWVYFSNNFTATANEAAAALFELQSAGAVELAFGFRIADASTDVINFGIGKLTPTVWGTQAIQRGLWHLVEIDVSLDAGGGNDGAATIYVTPDGSGRTAGTAHATVGTLNQLAVTKGVLGIQDHLATTTGTILFDGFVMDNAARVQGELDRWNSTIRMTQSGHAFVGSGVIDNITLVGNGAASQELRLWDTDEALGVGGMGHPRIELHTTGTSEIVDPASMPLRINKGCYIELDDAVDSSALVQVAFASGWGSESNVIRHGLAR